jgi:hypothetical protein
MNTRRLTQQENKKKRIWIISLWAVFCIIVPLTSLSFLLFWREGLTWLRWVLEVGSLVLAGYCVYLIYRWLQDEHTLETCRQAHMFTYKGRGYLHSRPFQINRHFALYRK